MFYCFPGCAAQICIVLGQQDGVLLSVWSDVSYSWAFPWCFLYFQAKETGSIVTEQCRGPAECPKEPERVPFRTVNAGVCCAWKRRKSVTLWGLFALNSWQNSSPMVKSNWLHGYSTSTCHILADPRNGLRTSASDSGIQRNLQLQDNSSGWRFVSREKTETFPSIIEYSSMHFWTTQPKLLHWSRFVNFVRLPFVLGFRLF